MKFYASFPIQAQSLLNNRAINYGDGLFETILCKNGIIPLWDLHLSRLKNGLTRLNIDQVDGDVLYNKIIELCGNERDCIAKIVVFRDDDKRGYSSASTQFQFYIVVSELNVKKTSQELTVSHIKLSQQKQLAGLKHLNRLEQVMAANQLIGGSFNDAIMLNEKSQVIETISKNIILIKGEKLYTAKLNKCGVNGVALRWLSKQGYTIKQKKIALKSLSKYDALMVCNSITGFNAITNVDNKFQFETNLPIIAEIKQKWHSHINS